MMGDQVTEAGIGQQEQPGPCVVSDGVCEEHGALEKKWRPKKTWTKGRNGLYSWKYSKVVYYACTGPTTRVGHHSHRPTFLMLKDSVMKTDDNAKKTSRGKGNQTR